MYEFICSADEKDSGFGACSSIWALVHKTSDFFDDENPFIILFYSQKIPINPLSNKPILGTTFAAKDEFS